MNDTIHLLVDQGVDSGRKIHVPPGGARLGRSSKNDISIVDPSLSRHHCRLFFKPDGSLWVTDLGSANETLVNDKAIQETRLHAGDRMTIGDTALHVLHDGIHALADLQSHGPPVVDLGLGDKPASAGGSRGNAFRRRMLMLIIGLACAFALVMWLPTLPSRLTQQQPAPQPKAPPQDLSLAIHYEKVQADHDNIFRYFLTLSKENRLTIEIDDLANDRHVRKEKQVEPQFVRLLANDIRDSGFDTLSQDYQGIRLNVLDESRLGITLGNRHHQVQVRNRVEPEIFKQVRETIENFGKDELGLWAIQFSSEELIGMAREALLLARKRYDEKEIRYGNLAEALLNLQEAEWYLETVEPKPEFYLDMLSLMSDARDELQARYDDRMFQAQRSIKLENWTEAARQLRILLELIPNHSDPRHQEARRKLLDAERRLQAR